MLNPPSGITPYAATFSGSYTDLPGGHNLSTYFVYGPGPCNSFPNGNSSSTPLQTTASASINGTVPPVTVSDLEPIGSYCVSLCLQDDTAGSGFTCTAPTSFSTPKAPEVITDPPYNVGFQNGSTFIGSYNSFVSGHTLWAYYLYGECDTFPATAVGTYTETITAAPGNGTLSPVIITGLSPEQIYCVTACVIDVDVNRFQSLCGNVQNFTWTSPVGLSLLN